MPLRNLEQRIICSNYKILWLTITIRKALALHKPQYTHILGSGCVLVVVMMTENLRSKYVVCIWEEYITACGYIGENFEIFTQVFNLTGCFTTVFYCKWCSVGVIPFFHHIVWLDRLCTTCGMQYSCEACRIILGWNKHCKI